MEILGMVYVGRWWYLRCCLHRRDKPLFVVNLSRFT